MQRSDRSRKRGTVPNLGSNGSPTDVRPLERENSGGHINDDHAPRLSMNQVGMSATLLEITTIYEKVRKGRDNETYRLSKHGFPPPRDLVSSTRGSVQGTEDDTMPLVPQFNVIVGKSDSQDIRYLEFNKFNNIVIRKYLYFSSETQAIQSDTLDGLNFNGMNFTELLKKEYYWFNITDPNESDLAVLFNAFKVHDFTLADIREKDTEEKIEFYQHYTFMSTRLLREIKIVHPENLSRRNGSTEEDEIGPLAKIVVESNGVGDRYPTSADSIGIEPVDMDFNILIFKNFAITMHDKKWTSINDILGFLSVLCQETILTPDWVLYSLFIELAQDAEYLLGRIEPRLNEVRLGSTANIKEMSQVLHENYEMEFQLYTIQRFLKPKVNILRTIKVKCGRRFGKILLGFLNEIREDFVEMYNDLRNFNHILERSQDTFLALVSVEKSREANEMSQGMNRISLVALIFLPITAISGFFGMNVEVPWQSDKEHSLVYFWVIVIVSMICPVALYCFGSFLFRKLRCCRRKKEDAEKEKSLWQRRRTMSRSRGRGGRDRVSTTGRI